jgi:cytochrome c
MSAIRPVRLIALGALLGTLAACATPVTGSAASGDASSDASSDVSDETTGDAANGRELFMTNACVACHGVTKDDSSKPGPSLFGVMGRKAGTSKSLYGASENLKKYGVIWNAQTLDEFLSDPDAKVPGTLMTGKLTDPKLRADVIAYLSTLKE